MLAPALAFSQAPQPTATARPVFAIRAGGAIDWDSNVFQLSDSVDPVAQLGTSTKSDTVTSVLASTSSIASSISILTGA
jgi:hypothetical protein